MNPYVEGAIACILNDDGMPAGGGVLVSPRHIATCAHVVATAWGKGRRLDVPLDKTVAIAFPFRRITVTVH